nr:hypothetical protein [Xanthomonas arboricola]
MDRAKLRIDLNHLHAAVPALRASIPNRYHFLRAFACIARLIKEKVLTSKDADFVGRCIDEMLSWHGLAGGENKVKPIGC